MTIGFSPCPNDTFIFDALVNGKIDTHGLVFDVVMDDVQTLNQWAIEGRLDISKISYGVLPKVLAHYKVLQSGGALGFGVGPLLIGQRAAPTESADLAAMVNQMPVAIPGADTTAHLLFSKAFPHAVNKQFLPFNQIEQFVLEGKGLGVIIHENRFTYHQKGLHEWLDLGSFWEEATRGPIPLGGIVMKKHFDASIAKKVNQLITESLAFARGEYPNLPAYVQQHAQEMDPGIMRQHIDLYVNAYSEGLGPAGEEAVLQLWRASGQLTQSEDDIFWR